MVKRNMHVYLLKAMRVTPDIFRRLVAQNKCLDTPTGPDRFSPREVVAHLADWEPIIRGRMEAAVANNGASVPTFDEGEMAVENKYNEWEIERALSLYGTERGKTVSWLASLSKDAWTHFVVHPEQGPLTVYDIANIMVGHDMYHVDQLTSVCLSDG